MMLSTAFARRASWAVRLGWLMFTVAALWLVWSWNLHPTSASAEVAVVNTPQEMERLRPGQVFALRGELQPVDAESKLWRGRMAWTRTERLSRFGSGAARVVDEHRPAVELQWSGGRWLLPENSYDLTSASKIPDDPWYHWNQGNRGFRPGDRVIALGRVDRQRQPVIQQLAAAPMGAYTHAVSTSARTRSALVVVLQILLTLGVIVIAWSAVLRTRTSRRLVRMMLDAHEQRRVRREH